LAEIGKVLGYYTKAEYESDYRFDVVWWSSEGDFRVVGGALQRSSRFSVVIVWPRPWLGLSTHWISGTSTDYT